MAISMLVPLDGSELAERATPSALRLASVANGRIVFAHARDLRVRTEGAAYDLIAVTERLRQHGVTVEACVADLVPGEESEVIHRLTREHRADFIVMSTYGWAGQDRRFRGSILVSAEVPVLLVPALQQNPWPPDRPLRILARLDSSQTASETLEPAARLAHAVDATLIVLRIVEIRHVTTRDPGFVHLRLDWEAELADAQRILDIVGRLRDAGRTVELRAIVAAPGFDVASLAIGEEIDIIAIATDGYGGIDDLMFGRVSTRTLKRGGVPVLLTGKVTVEPPAESTAPIPGFLADGTGPAPHVIASP
jgi:nucleotide-binding universal stress UspA family protein